jgi:ABC-type iron transport system FetAB ATPase subunit
MIFMEIKDRYLTLDAAQPLVCTDKIMDEMILYRIPDSRMDALLQDFARITGKKADPESSLLSFSGGQKVILMVLLSLYSPAKALCFRDLFYSLDQDKQPNIQALLSASDKEIIFEDIP